MKVVYPAVFHPYDDGCITVWFPDLDDATTEGKSAADAIDMARDLLAIWMDSADEQGRRIPAPSNIVDISTEAGEYVTLIDADPGEYIRKRKSAAVRRTVSLPQWLDDMAISANLSLSRELQDALCQRFHVEG